MVKQSGQPVSLPPPAGPDVPRLLLRHITPAAGAALYQQIIDAVKREVGEGRLPPGYAMPSFRVLARELMVSLITVKRAYEELEREGILTLRQGLGTFVAEKADDASRRAMTSEAQRLMRLAVREAREAGLGPRHIRRMLHEIIEEGEHHK